MNIKLNINGYSSLMYDKRIATCIKDNIINKNKSNDDILDESFTQTAHELGYKDYKVIKVGGKHEGVIGGHGKMVSGKLAEIGFLIDKRKDINREFINILNNNNFSLSHDETIKFTCDKDFNITVSGLNDYQRKIELEEIINSDDNFREDLFFHIQTINSYHGKVENRVFNKWHVYNFMTNVGQDIDKLKIENEQIVGANKKLQEIIDNGSTSPYYGMIIKSINVLRQGITNIPDIKQQIEFSNESFNDINVDNGFGTNQLDKWLDKVKANNKSIDIYG